MPPHSDVSDNYLSEHGARILASRIQQFWRGLGYLAATTWTEPGGFEGKSYYVVRSNLRCGIPPGGRSVM